MAARSQVEQVFITTLELQDPVDWSVVRYQEVEGWDSLGHMAMIAELEDGFGIMFETDDIIDMSTFDKALEILTKYGVELE